MIALLMCVLSVPAAAATFTDPRTIPLIDQKGSTFRLQDLAGVPVVLTFVASRCTDACPIANAAFSQAYTRLRHDRIKALLLTMTLDPDYDTPSVMARVARRFHASSAGWRFASGRPADIRQLMQSLGVEVQPDEHGIPDVHTSFVYVLDRNVRLKSTLLLSTRLTEDLEDVLLRLQEKSQSPRSQVGSGT